ncbi:MAG: hypothetical protein ABIO44_00930 [Saprospiraceae bacterium]
MTNRFKSVKLLLGSNPNPDLDIFSNTSWCAAVYDKNHRLNTFEFLSNRGYYLSKDTMTQLIYI